MAGSMEHLPILVLVISLLSSFTVFVAGWLNRKSCVVISIATAAILFIMSLLVLRHVLTQGPIRYWLGGWKPPWGIEYAVDALNAYILVVLRQRLKQSQSASPSDTVRRSAPSLLSMRQH